MEAAFKTTGYKAQTHELSYFHDDYGLKTGDDDDEEDEEDEDEDMEGSEGSSGSDESED